MDYKVLVLEKLIAWLVGGQAFEIIVGMVKSLMDDDKTNDEKRNEVKEVVPPMLSEVGKFVLSTAIAFSVDKIKAELE